jgi:hypothetical protein
MWEWFERFEVEPWFMSAKNQGVVLSPTMSPKPFRYRDFPIAAIYSGAVSMHYYPCPAAISISRNAQVVSSNPTISSSKIRASGVFAPGPSSFLVPVWGMS